MKKSLAAIWRLRNTGGKTQPLLLLLMGVIFMIVGFRTYPAFIGVGSLFLIIAYRGFTCQPDEIIDRE